MSQRDDPIKTNYANNSGTALALVTYDPSKPGEAANALKNSHALDSYQGIASRTRFEDIHDNSSVRNEFTRNDYEAYRPGESIPKGRKGIQFACNRAYKKVGIVRTTIDLMADFAADGVRLNHPNKRTQSFARKWFSHTVRGQEVTERFLNYLYRLGVVVGQRQMATITISEQRALAIAGDEKLKPTKKLDKPLKTGKRNIPCGYTFLNPVTLEVAGGELAQFTGERIYALRINGSLRQKIAYPKNDIERMMVAKLPEKLRAAVSAGKNLLPLDNEKLTVHGYKQDDWEEWPSPMLEGILDDLVLLEKMKLADLAALDGAISQIRIWTIGDLALGILPTDAAVQKLADILLSNPGGGAFDLIWGPELKFVDASTNVHQFLGGEKYVPVYEAIHGGLGVPPTLTGSSKAGGMTNNFISLQTLVQRLEYGRQLVTCFWEQECELLRQAMGWKKAPTISFNNMILKDEAAEKALLIQLVDRNLVSEELLVERFGESSELEDLRKRREQRERDKGNRLPQAGPYYASEKEHELIKTALGKGYLTPEQAGIDVDEEDDSDTPFDKQMKAMEQKAAQVGGGGQQKGTTGKSGQGRPKTSKDSPGTSRTRTPKIRTSAEMEDDVTEFLSGIGWAKQAQAKISEVLIPGFLHHYNKKNVRSLSASQAAEAEMIKFKILSNLPKYSEVTKELVVSAIKDSVLPVEYRICYQKLVTAQRAQTNKEPTVDELRHLQAAVYSLFS